MKTINAKTIPQIKADIARKLDKAGHDGLEVSAFNATEALMLAFMQVEGDVTILIWEDETKDARFRWREEGDPSPFVQLTASRIRRDPPDRRVKSYLYQETSAKA